MSKERLQRIEDKVDEMGQAILALARMEEKVITIFKRLDNMEKKNLMSEWMKLKSKPSQEVRR